MGTQSKYALVRMSESIAMRMALFWIVALSGLANALAGDVTLKVVSARAEPKAFGGTGVAKGTPVTSYKYLINIDNTGTTTQRSPSGGCSYTDAGYPDSCKWTSIAGTPSSSPIFTQGTEADFAAPMSIPDGRYLISVLADGYKLDGRHFTVAGSSVTWEGKAGGDPASEVKVELQPAPLPDAQIQAAVFEDISPVNSAPDLPAEHGLAGFQGHITDYLGEVTTNLYGDPLCSKYDAGGALIPGSGGKCLSACYVVSGGVDVGTVAPVDAAGRCPTSPTLANGSPRPMLEGGFAPAGAAIEGKLKIPNLGPNRYALSITPPDGSNWQQTTTLEGNLDWDAWVMEGATGLDTEFVVAGEPFPALIFGYVRSAPIGRWHRIIGPGGAIRCHRRRKSLRTDHGRRGGLPEQFGAAWPARRLKAIQYPWIALTDLTNGDTAVWIGQGDANGRFTIPNVPEGNYTLTWWDSNLNYILDLVQVTVGPNESVDMGVLPLTGWWTKFEGYVYNDTNNNGKKDPGEAGLANYPVTMKKRENSLMDRGAVTVTTDANGYYVMRQRLPDDAVAGHGGLR